MQNRPRYADTKGLDKTVLDTIPIVSFSRAGSVERLNIVPSETHSVFDSRRPRDIETCTTHSCDDSILSRARSQRSLTIQQQQPNTSSCTAETRSLSPSLTGSIASSSCSAASSSELSLALPAPSQHQCPVCMEDFGEGQLLRALPCYHNFHQTCIDPWLLNISGSCPLCRVDLRPEEHRQPFQMPPPPPPGTQIPQTPRFLQYIEVYRTTAPNSVDRLMRLQAIQAQRVGRSAVPEFGITRLKAFIKKKRGKGDVTPDTATD